GAVGDDTHRSGHLGEITVEVEPTERPCHGVSGGPVRALPDGPQSGRDDDRVRVDQTHAGSLWCGHGRPLRTAVGWTRLTLPSGPCAARSWSGWMGDSNAAASSPG